MSDRISVDGLAEAIMDRLEEYKDLAVDEMKTAVKAAGKTVKEGIAQTAPGSGKYANSWISRTTAESSSDIEVTVYSPRRYRIAHLLEKGHLLRNGQRSRAFPHIAPSQEKGEDQLMSDLEKALKG